MSASAAEHAHHAKPLPHEYPSDPFFGKATLGKIGMWIFLLSDALMFAGFLLGYGMLRVFSELHPVAGETGTASWRLPGEPELGIPFTAFLTFWLICSSVAMVFAYAAAVENDRKKTMFWLFLTAMGGVGFLCGQAYEWTHLIHQGLIFGHSHYASTFYVITGFHGFHVLSGTVYLFAMLYRTWRGHFTDGNYNDIEICGLFWHFVDLIWILVFTFVYLL